MNEYGSDERLNRTEPQIVAEGLGWPEGPTLLSDGSIGFVETYRSRVSKWSPITGEVTSLSEVGGGPNAVLAGNDEVYFTQNSGIVGPWRAPERRTPGIWRIDGSRTATPFTTSFEGRSFGAPNDLAFGPDGRLYFTDPGESFRIDDPTCPGHIFAIDDGANIELIIEAGKVFPNGLAFNSDGALFWTETYTHRVMRLVDGSPEVFVHLAPGTAPDGFTFAEGDLLFVTTGGGGKSIEIYSPDGEHLDSIRFPEDSAPSNCLFVGQTLYVTDGGCEGSSTEARLDGRLWAIDFEHASGAAKVHRT